MNALASGIRQPRTVLVVRLGAGESSYVSTLGAEVAIGPEPAACLRDAACNLVAPCRDFLPHHLGVHDWRTWADCLGCGRVFLMRREA